mgnify:FL=1
MSTVQVSAHMLVSGGHHLEQFKAAMNKCRALVEKNELNTNLLYDWFLHDEDECEVRETFTGSDAFLAHLDNVGDALKELLQHANLIELRIYGDPSEKLMAALTEAKLPVEVYTPL